MKIWFRRISTVGVLFFPLCACALDVTYGSFFTVRGIAQKDGRPVLPLTRGQYANVRILDKDTWASLSACKSTLCRQKASGGETEVVSLRAAKTRPGMWIADISVDRRWLLTFLVFQNTRGYSVKAPEVIHIENEDWLHQLKQRILDAVARLKTEGKDGV